MSRKLLEALNGGSRGAFRSWLDNFQGEPRIAWYPSAGEDFRDTLYLHPNFAKLVPSTQTEPSSPDIFLHTDYFPWKYSNFLDTRRIYVDDRTSVYLKSMEELPNCNLPLDSGIVDFEQGSVATGRVLFLEIAIDSKKIGKFHAPVIYAFVENAAFCERIALANAAKFSHIIHIRFGGGLGGGGKSSGIWLLNILKTLACEVLVTDDHYYISRGDERIYELYPQLACKEGDSHLETIRVLNGQAWSNHGNISWKVVK